MEIKKPVKREFKRGIKLEDSRRRREETSIKLRKEKKDEGIAKKRNILGLNGATADVPAETEGSATSTAPSTSSKKIYAISDMPELLQGLQSAEVATQIECLRGFRRLLSIEGNPPVKECIDCGAMPFFVHFLQRFDSAELQFEAAWALTNIASTEFTRSLVEFNAVPFLVGLLSSPNPDLREQCAWCLGNIAGDGTQLRDYVLSQNPVQALLANIAQPASLSLLRNCTWSLSNICRGKPQPPLDTIAPALPLLAALLTQQDDQETMVDAMWALSYISDGDDARIQAVVEQPGLVQALVKNLASGKTPLAVPALRSLGNIVSGNDLQTQAVLDANVVPALSPLLSHPKKNVRKETCWMLSNIAAGRVDQLNLLFNVPDLIPNVLMQLSSTTEWDVRKEAAWVICNIATVGQKVHVMRLVEYGAVRPLCSLLDVSEVNILKIVMEGLEAMLKLDADPSINVNIAHLVDEAGGVDALEQAQQHEDEGVYRRSVALLEKYFGAEDEENEAENVAPTAAADNSTYNFGVTTTTGNAKLDFGSPFFAGIAENSNSNSTAPDLPSQQMQFSF